MCDDLVRETSIRWGTQGIIRFKPSGERQSYGPLQGSPEDRGTSVTSFPSKVSPSLSDAMKVTCSEVGMLVVSR
jgi:hypothetical protein